MDNIVVLNDEHGNEVEFEYLDLIEHNNEAYVVLLPVEDDTDEVVILRCEESDDDSDEENYRSVEDQELLNEIFEIFKEKNKDKTKGKKKEKQFKYTNEGKLMMIRYNLDEKKVDYRELLRWTSFCNAFVISLTCTIICNIPLKMYYQLAIGFVILFGLIYSIFEIVGRHLNKKWGKENGK